VPSIEPYISSYKEHGCKEVSGCFIVAGSNTPKLLEFSEEVLDQVARFIHVFIVSARFFSVGF